MPAPATPLITHKPDFQRALLGWYRANARALPWREAPSLYKTVVSEFMLQQTQVKTVLPYFARWLAEFPDFAALATASEARVLKLWEGLGYYARARNLHRLAKVLAARPEAPRTVVEWRELPGVGPYTAAAIVSIAFGDAAACVDGNVVRILARLTADGSKFRDSASAARELSPLADAVSGLPRAGVLHRGAGWRRQEISPVCPENDRASRRGAGVVRTRGKAFTASHRRGRAAAGGTARTAHGRAGRARGQDRRAWTVAPAPDARDHALADHGVDLCVAKKNLHAQPGAGVDFTGQTRKGLPVRSAPAMGAGDSGQIPG
jgi:endonuclease III